MFIKVPWPHKALLPCLENFLVAHLHSGIILFAKNSILNVWVFWIHHFTDNCYVLRQTRILAFSKHHFFRYMVSYSIIFSVIKAYSHILRHYQGIFRLIKAYSTPCVTLAYSKPCHILSPVKHWPGIFRTLPWGII